MSLDLVRARAGRSRLWECSAAYLQPQSGRRFLRDMLHMNGFANVQPAYMWEALRMMERGVVNPQEYFSHTFSLLTDVDRRLQPSSKSDGAMKMLILP